MKVKDLIELLDSVNPEYEVKLDIAYTLEDSFVSDYATKTIYMETLDECNTNSNKYNGPSNTNDRSE